MGYHGRSVKMFLWNFSRSVLLQKLRVKMKCEKKKKKRENERLSLLVEFFLDVKRWICESRLLRRVCVCGEKVMSISLSIIQSNAVCQTVSLGPRRDTGRVEMRQSALPSGLFLH